MKPIKFIGGAVAVMACLSGLPAAANQGTINDVCYTSGGADSVVLRLTVKYLGRLSAQGETPVQRTYSVAGVLKDGPIVPVDGSITVAQGVAARMVLTEAPGRFDNGVAAIYGCTGGPNPVPASWTCAIAATDGNTTSGITLDRVKPSTINPDCRVFAPN